MTKALKLKDKTLEKLRELINEEIEYRSGPKLVDLFNKYGSDDIYQQGFPSRWAYTDMKLGGINNTPHMEQLIKDLFNPINFIPNFDSLDEIILEFNMYLEFDGYKLNRNKKTIQVLKISDDENILQNNIVFDEAYIHEQWQKALDRKQKDPEGAITISRTLIESILKLILDEQGIKYRNNIELSELYKEVSKLLNLAPENHQEQIFKQILGNANGVISGLGSLRNKLGDSHGSGKTKIKPKERHSELAVNLAGSMATFIYKTYKETDVSN